jgi:CRP-like cAMP-binding protein
LDVRHYRPGEFIFDMGEQAGTVYFLEKGIIKITILSPDGRERILDIVNAGDTFGEAFLSNGKRRTAAAQSLTSSTVRTMALEMFMNLMQTLPNLCLNFVHHLTDLQRRTLVRLDAQMQLDRGLRLLAVLLDLAERCGERSGDTYRLPGELTQSELARMVGLNRSTVSVLLNYYRRGGILGGQRGMLVIYAVPARALLEQAGLLFCSRSNRGYGPVRPSDRSDRA